MILRAYLDGVHADHLRLGFRSGNCDRCTPIGWHDDARARRLRTAIVGGTPIDSELESRRVEVSPRPSASRLQLAAEGQPGRCVLGRTG
jgi:hypothetical protein